MHPALHVAARRCNPGPACALQLAHQRDLQLGPVQHEELRRRPGRVRRLPRQAHPGLVDLAQHLTAIDPERQEAVADLEPVLGDRRAMHDGSPQSMLCRIHVGVAGRASVPESRSIEFSAPSHVSHLISLLSLHLHRSPRRRCYGGDRSIDHLLPLLVVENPPPLNVEEGRLSDLDPLCHCQEGALLRPRPDPGGVRVRAPGPEGDAMGRDDNVVPTPPLDVHLDHAQPRVAPRLDVEGPALGTGEAQERRAIAASPLDDRRDHALLQPAGHLGAGVLRPAPQGEAGTVHNDVVPLAQLRAGAGGRLGSPRLPRRRRLVLREGAPHELPPVCKVHGPAAAVREAKEGALHLDGPDPLVDENHVEGVQVQAGNRLRQVRGRPRRRQRQHGHADCGLVLPAAVDHLDLDHPDRLVLGRHIEEPAVARAQAEPLGPTGPPAPVHHHDRALPVARTVPPLRALAVARVIPRPDARRIDHQVPPLPSLLLHDVSVAVCMLCSRDTAVKVFNCL
mmetsp:Transcript_20750/g.58391  ORF Transcript_20750/g.58391 Transcript_20750/m.58391 type:complete len:508 (-) Transcript_20750:172-1695(-)